MARLHVLAAVLLALLASQAAARAPCKMHRLAGAGSDNDACSACEVAVHVLDDLLCDATVDDAVADWVIANVCSQMGDSTQQCSDLVSGLTPAVVEWLRAYASPQALCAEAGICGAAPNGGAVAPRMLRSSRRPNGLACPLCMYLAAKVKEELSDPVTQEQIHDRSMAACAAMPAGSMQEACGSFVEQYEMTFVKYIGSMEPEEVCLLTGTCLDAAVQRLGAPAPLRAPAAAAAGRLAALLRAPPTNDHCETCKAVVQEMHALVANPDLQGQVVDYAKQACGLVPSLAETCEADVDQYAPMVFGMVLAYLQPQQVCEQLKMCPPPSRSWAEPLALQASMLRSKYARLGGEARLLPA